jgi:hypothetical protein
MTALHLVRRGAVVALVLAAGLLWSAPLAAARSGTQTGPAPSNDCFIRGLYRDVLGRAPDSTELAAGLAYLGSHAQQEYATTLLTSDEYRTLLIQGWYQKFLGRTAGGGEITPWLALFAGGSKDEDIIAGLLSSVEYFNQPRVGGNNTGFVHAIYQDLLGRDPSPGDLSTWLAFLGTHNRFEMAQFFLSSTEYRTDIIQSWYQKYLGRAADSTEVNTGLTTLSSGGTDEDVIAFVLGSVEYYARAGLCSLYLPIIAR